MYSLALPLGAHLVVTVEVSSDAELSKLIEKLQDPSSVLPELAAIIRDAYRKNFSEGGRPEWQALAKSTVAAKQAAGLPALGKNGKIPKRLMQRGAFGATNILIATGRLRDSYVQQGHADHVEIYQTSQKEGGISVEVGSSVPYAAAHQGGTQPYTIMAKNAKCLAFIGAGGETVFRKKVSHPGLPSRPQTITDDDIAKMVQVVYKHISE